VAILIELRRIENDDQTAVYEYGFQDSPKGQIAIDKQSGECVELQPVPFARDGVEYGGDFFFTRARRVLVKHFEVGEYPEETMYCA
jgi:hypothetical protein